MDSKGNQALRQKKKTAVIGTQPFNLENQRSLFSDNIVVASLELPSSIFLFVQK